MSLQRFQLYMTLIMVVAMINTVIAWQEGNYTVAGALGAVSAILLLAVLAAINMENRQ